MPVLARIGCQAFVVICGNGARGKGAYASVLPVAWCWCCMVQVTGETNKVRFGGVNSRVNWDIPEKWGVTSYPWIASFYQGKKVEDMRGLSGAQSVVNFAKEEMMKANPAGEEPRLRSPNHPPPGPQSANAQKGGAAASVSGKGAAGNGAVAVDDGKALVYGGENADSYSSLPWREQLGRHAWFYLHTLAATYPQFPTDADKNAVRMLMASFGQLFPCKLCRRHLQGNLADPDLGPVAVESREAHNPKSVVYTVTLCSTYSRALTVRMCFRPCPSGCASCTIL